MTAATAATPLVTPALGQIDDFDPYLTFRFLIFAVTTIYVIYQLVALAVWYAELPRIVRRYIVLVCVRLRWKTIGRELFLVVVLTAVWLWVAYLNLRLGWAYS